MEQLFSQHLLMHPETGGRFIMDRDRPVSLTSLELEMVKHRLADTKLQAGTVSASFSAEIAVFQRRRPGGMQAYWSLTSSYKSLGLSAFKFPSNWVQRSAPRWLRACKTAFGICDGALILSCSHADSADKKNSCPWSDRGLPFPGISTWALLLLAVRWSPLPREVGGFSCDKGRKACDLLAAFLRSVISGEGEPEWSFDLVLSKRWTLPWPRPVGAAAGPRIKIRLVGGRMCLEALLAAGGGQERTAAAHTWAKSLFGPAAKREETLPLGCVSSATF